MKLNLNELNVESFTIENGQEITYAPATGPEGPYSLCWICRPSDPGVPTCDEPKPVPIEPIYTPRSYIVDSICLCYA